ASEEPAYRPVRLGHADGHDGERRASKPGLQCSPARHFRPAWLTPGGEEMQEHHLTAKLRKLARGTVEARQRERWLGGIGKREQPRLPRRPAVGGAGPRPGPAAGG